MWKKLALLVAVASAVTQAVRYWNEAGTQAAAKRKRDARADVQRWEDEGGNLPPSPGHEPATDARPAARKAASRRTRAGHANGSAGADADSPSATVSG